MVKPTCLYVSFLFALKIFGAEIPGDVNLEVTLRSWTETQFPNDQKIISNAFEIYKKEYPEYLVKGLGALYQTVFVDKDNYRFARDFIFMLKRATEFDLITRNCALAMINEKLGSTQNNFNFNKTLNEMSRFELINTDIIFGMFLADNNFDPTEKYRKICPVESREALLLSIEFVKSRRENWCFFLIIETMDLFKRIKAGGHFQALKGALKILSLHESKNGPLEDWIIVNTIKLCYYNQNSFDSYFQKLIAKLLCELKNIDKNELRDHFKEKALSIGLKGDRYSFIQASEMLHNQCLVF